MTSRIAVSSLILTGFLSTSPLCVAAQGLKIAVGDVGMGLGDVPRLDGLRLNVRDRALERVRGVNVTLWEPYDGADGVVRGLALGLPLTGAAEITGMALGAGVAVDRAFTGIGLAPLGFGAGDRIRGIAVGGLGMGGGGRLKGLMIGGVGLGVGGDIRGVAIGGVGAGAGGSMKGLVAGGVGLGVGGALTGVAVGGVGVGASGTIRGLVVGGVGVGAGGDVKGITIGGVGVGAGGDITGITIGGAGIGAGGHLKGLNVAGAGVGAPRITGATLTGFGVGGERVTGFVLAPAYFKIQEGGWFRGVGVSAWSRIEGRQTGLTIGLLNVAEELHGLQIGLVNIARNKESFSVLPLVNWHR